MLYAYQFIDEYLYPAVKKGLNEILLKESFLSLLLILDIWQLKKSNFTLKLPIKISRMKLLN